MEIFSILLLLFSSYLAESAQVCYFSSWSVHWPKPGQFDIEKINPFLCTHIIYQYAGLNSLTNEIKVLDPYTDLCEDSWKCGYRKINHLKSINPDLKTLLCVGGLHEGTFKYSQMASDPSTRAVFISSAIKLLLKHGFDGMDFDWQYPTMNYDSVEDKQTYPILLEELSTAMHKEGLILTIKVPAAKDIIDAGYNIPRVSSSVDLILVESYNFHGYWESKTHHPSLLYRHHKDTADDRTLNVDWVIKYWLKKGAPREKLVMGTALFYRCWSLDLPNNIGINAPASKPSPPGPYTRRSGILSYQEVLASMGDHLWTTIHDYTINEPFSYMHSNKSIWCGGEDQRSIAAKGRYAKQMGLKGVMVMSIDNDDWSGRYSYIAYPLVRSLFAAFMGDNGKYNELVSHAETTPAYKPLVSSRCTSVDVYTDNKDCTHFTLCALNEHRAFTEINLPCPTPYLFDNVNKICDLPKNVCRRPGVCPNDCKH